jgi:hypothetical protein
MLAVGGQMKRPALPRVWVRAASCIRMRSGPHTAVATHATPDSAPRAEANSAAATTC